MASVSLSRIIEKFKLENLTPEIETKGDQDYSAGYQQTGAAACRLF